MNEQHIRLKSVFELRVDESGQPIRYFIPAYQRGYRWTSTQVTQLLDDILEFARRNNPQPNEFYCLQPLVLLAREDGAYEVVDGQQRLTTILLILKHLRKLNSSKLFSLEYETRPNLPEFLANPTDELADANIDYFHIAQATNSIRVWFEKNENEIYAIADNFLNKAKVIWFQLSPSENPVAAFTRLNVGKIPLTNGELIRALLLRNSPGEAAEARRLRIAYEWDLVEKALQNSSFWSFLRNDVGHSGSRIDFLFDLTARRQGMSSSADEYATFYYFSQELAQDGADPAAAWLEVKKTYMLLAEWFEDRRLYHLVGFLIWGGMDINALRSLADGKRKGELKEILRTKIVERAFGAGAPKEVEAVRSWLSDRLDQLVYPRDRVRIRSTLLLFNLATLLQHSQSNVRFNFESFKAERWDIEHVRSVASAELRSSKLQSEWLTHTQRYLELVSQENDSLTLQAKIEAHLKLPPKEGVAEFESLYEDLLTYFHEDEGEGPDNSIANLALLDQETNRSYKNAVFPVKRQRVLKLDEHGVFVPHCTRNVFLKCYSPRVDHTLYWTQEDRDGYRQELLETLLTFITGEWINA
jgi:hypothetical protein